MTNAQMAHKMGLDKFTGYVEDCDRLASTLKTMGFKVEKDDRRVFEATITDDCDNTMTVRFGNDMDNLITARIDKINGTHKWYYGKTLAQMLAVVRQCMEGYTFPEPTEEPKTKEEEETMTYTAEEIAHMTEETDRISEQEEQETIDQTKAEEEAKEIMKEEETMETKTTFTTLDGTTYTMNPKTSRYSKTVNGKTTRIGLAEYESAKHEYETEQYIANLDLHPTAEYEQAELDKKPCIVDPMADLQKPAVLNEFGCVDCSECHVKPCVHRDCMRRNPRSEGGLGECPRLNVKPIVIDEGVVDTELEEIIDETGLEPAEAELERNIRNEQKTKKAKKASKPRRSKDIAYEGNGVTLTAKQVDFIHHLPDTCYWEMGIDSVVWVDCLCDDIGGQFADKPMTVGAMVSTLCEKGLGFRTRDTSREGKPIAFSLTELGKKIAGDLGLE